MDEQFQNDCLGPRKIFSGSDGSVIFVSLVTAKQCPGLRVTRGRLHSIDSMVRSPKANVFIHLDLSEQVEVAVQTQAAKFVLNEIQKEHHRHQLGTVSGWASLRIVNHVILAIVICSGSKTREATVVSALDDGGETKPKIYNGFTLHLAEKMEQKALA